MQLQILFTDDTAWMNLVDSGCARTLPVLVAKQPSIPLYFIMNDGEILAGPQARKWYFASYAKLDLLGEPYFGNLLEYIHSEKTFDYKGEERSGAYLVTWLYDYAKEYMRKNISSEEIDEIAIAGLPAWSDDDLMKLKDQLDVCRPTKIIPLHSFFVNADFVALPVAREFQLGKFENGKWKMLHKSPKFDADIRIRSMAERMVNDVCREFTLSEEQKSAEIRSCEAYLKEKNVLSVLETEGEFKGAYSGVSELGLNEISVLFAKKNALVPDDQRTIVALAQNIKAKLEYSGCSNGTIEFIGDGYCIPEFQREFKERLVAHTLHFVSTELFFKEIFSREWSEKNSVPVVGSAAAKINSVSTLAISNLHPNDIVYLHGADIGKEDSEKELRYLGNNRFETIKNTRKWSKPHDTLTALDALWCVGQKLRLKLEKTGQIAATRTITEIKAPVREAKSAPQPSAAPKVSSACASAFEVAGSAGIEKNVSLNEINISSLNAGDIVSLHGVDPNGVKAPTRKELRYLGGGRFETIENTRGWSHAGDIVVAKDSVWTLHQSLRFMLERTGQVASTRMIDSMQVK